MKYAFQGEKEGTARAITRGIRVSFKESYEVANAIRGKKLSSARKFLSEVVEAKTPVPYKKFNHGVPHRPGIGPGRYPRNTSQKFIKLLNEVEANAEARGLNSELLKISHIAVQNARPIRGNFKGSPQYSPTVHVEIIVKENEELAVKTDKQEKKVKEEKKPKAEAKKEEKKEEKKPEAEVKKAEKKEEKKPETPTKEVKS